MKVWIQSNKYWEKEHLNFYFLKRSHNNCFFRQRNDLWHKLLVANWADEWGKMEADTSTQHCRISALRMLNKQSIKPIPFSSMFKVFERLKEHPVSSSYCPHPPQIHELTSSFMLYEWIYIYKHVLVIKDTVMQHHRWISENYTDF